MHIRMALFAVLASVSIAHGEELRSISAEHFVSESPSSERRAIVDFIVHQFDDKNEAGVSKAQLDALWHDLEARKALHLMRFQIINQNLYADSFSRDDYYFKPLLHYFEFLSKKYKINDVDFIVYGRDEIPTEGDFKEKANDVYAFMMSKDSNSPHEKGLLLLPDAFMIKDDNWQVLVERIEKANSEYPWEQKVEKLLWRGNATGSESKTFYNISNFDKLVRLKLVMLSRLYPDLLDALLISYNEISNDQDGANLKTVLKILFGKERSRIKEVDHLKYKYLVAVDGNTCPWVRVPWMMASNSVLVKQETSRMEWFYPAIKPYVHYVPLNDRLTDIFPQLAWMKEHDDEVKQISVNARNFIKNDLMPGHIEAHMVIILNQYSLLQKDEKVVATLPAASDVIRGYEENYSKLEKAKSLFKKWTK